MISPQLVSDSPAAVLLFLDDEWAAEEKLDGDRCIIVKRGNDVRGFTRNGSPMMLTDECVAVALISDADWMLDGEMMKGGQFIAFDMPELTLFSNEERRDALEGTSPFPVVRRATGEVAKRDLWASICRESGEGVVFKRLESRYVPASRSADTVRLKRYETESFVVKSVDFARASVEIADREGNSRGRVACSLSTLPKVGQVIRVRFDRVTESGKLLRPRLRA